jgi:hypothetical protein
MRRSWYNPRLPSVAHSAQVSVFDIVSNAPNAGSTQRSRRPAHFLHRTYRAATQTRRRQKRHNADRTQTEQRNADRTQTEQRNADRTQTEMRNTDRTQTEQRNTDRTQTEQRHNLDRTFTGRRNFDPAFTARRNVLPRVYRWPDRIEPACTDWHFRAAFRPPRTRVALRRKNAHDPGTCPGKGAVGCALSS